MKKGSLALSFVSIGCIILLFAVCILSPSYFPNLISEIMLSGVVAYLVTVTVALRRNVPFLTLAVLLLAFELPALALYEYYMFGFFVLPLITVCLVMYAVAQRSQPAPESGAVFGTTGLCIAVSSVPSIRSCLALQKKYREHYDPDFGVSVSDSGSFFVMKSIVFFLLLIAIAYGVFGIVNAIRSRKAGETDKITVIGLVLSINEIAVSIILLAYRFLMIGARLH